MRLVVPALGFGGSQIPGILISAHTLGVYIP